MSLIFAIKVVSNHGIVIIKANDVIDIEKKLSSILGDDYLYMYDYSFNTMGNYSLVFPKLFKKFNDDFVIEEGLNDVQIFQKCLDYVKEFTYVFNQSNPNDIKSKGGNCQAVSLVLHDLLNKNGLDSELVLEGNHLINKVYLDEFCYLVDLTNGVIIQE